MQKQASERGLQAQMLYIDSRTGSKDLAPLLIQRGLPVTLTRLDFADLSFVGSGPDGEPVSVGIEVKQMHDVLQCVTDGRFAGHQLPGLIQAYEQVWLLIEGMWRANQKTGMLEYRKRRGEWVELSIGTRRFMARDLWTWLMTMEIKGGIRIARVPRDSDDRHETIVWLATLYSWWVNKGWDGHKSHLVFNDGTRNGTPFKRDRAARMVASLSDRALLSRPSLCRMVSAQLPNVGWQKSQAVSERYKTVEALVGATTEELMELDGIGPKIAIGIYESLRSRK